MGKLSVRHIQDLLASGLSAPTRYEQGKALEDLICYVFGRVSGIEVSKRNKLNTFGTEEVDIAFWNAKLQNGLHFLPNIILVECKNWSNPLGSREVAYFAQLLQNRGRDYGILIAANGISGSATDVNQAHYEVAMSLSRGLNILVLTRSDLETLHSTEQLAYLLKEKLCELAVSGTVFA